MNPPTRIRVGALTYKVTTSKPAIDAACREEGVDLYGRTDHTRLIIALDPTNTEAMQRQVCLHEALHCLTERSGIANDYGAKDEENIVRRLAPGLLDLLRTNPQLLAYLTA